jgi:hypothetical protein
VVRDSPLAAAVKATGSAIGNYANRIQTVGNQLIDTGIAAIAHSPVAVALSAAVDVATHPSVIMDGLSTAMNTIGNAASTAWDATGAHLVNAVSSCVNDLGGCAVNVAKTAASVGAGLLAGAACEAATGGGGSAACLVIARAAGGAV